MRRTVLYIFIFWPVLVGLALGYAVAAARGGWDLWPLLGFAAGVGGSWLWTRYTSRSGLADRLAARLGVARER